MKKTLRLLAAWLVMGGSTLVYAGEPIPRSVNNLTKCFRNDNPSFSFDERINELNWLISQPRVEAQELYGRRVVIEAPFKATAPVFLGEDPTNNPAGWCVTLYK